MKHSFALFVALSFALGCGSREPKPATHREAEERGHSHERDKMLLADLGKKYAHHKE